MSNNINKVYTDPESPSGYFYISETQMGTFGVFNCNYDGRGEVIIGGVFDDSEDVQIALDSYATENGLAALSEEELADFHALESPSDDESEEKEPDTEPEELDEAEEKEENPEKIDEEEEPEAVTGDVLSLRSDEFDRIMDVADATLNKLISRLHAKGQRDGEMTLKITFEQSGSGYFLFAGAVSGKINDTVKPQKISDKSIDIQFDEFGTPVISANRQKQMTFDDAEKGVTVTTDADGLVEKVELDEEPEELTADCDKTNCPFYAIDIDGCGIVPGGEIAMDYEEVCQAVERYNCKRPKVTAEYEIFRGQEEPAEPAEELLPDDMYEDSLFDEEDYNNEYDGGDIA